jgi:SAM-dependent MidA family methyltransferase
VPPDAVPPSNRPDAGPLTRRLAEEIRASGPVTFARFMERALYEPELGYYARGGGRIGPGGDFFTASDAGTAFGECLARQLAEMDRVLGSPRRFSILENGGGRGLLARDVLDALGRMAPDLRSRAEYLLEDAGEGMRRAASENAPEAQVVVPGEAGTGHVGCVVAVELFDALPVHRVRRRAGRLVEVLVGLDAAGGLVELEGPPTPEAAELAAAYGAAPGEGDEAEVCPRLDAQLARMAAALERGFLLIVDYGYPADELYAPARRRGTLLAYHRHTVSEAYLARVGEQDLTAHVNFTHLLDAARRLGLDELALTTQDRWLIANGLLERFDEADPDRWAEPGRVRRRLQAMTLLHPERMGRTFKVVALGKGVSGVRLVGLRDPLARSGPAGGSV